MSATTRNLRQVATYWAPGSTRDIWNKQTYASPTAINVRWEDLQEEILLDSGETVVSRSRVYVDFDAAKGGFIFLGTSIATSPLEVAGAYEILSFKKTPSLNGKIFERHVRL